MNNIVNFEGSALGDVLYRLNIQVVYVNYDNNKNATDIFICDQNFNHANKVETIIEKIPHPKTIGKIKVTNNKINFFVPIDFNKTEAPDQKRITSGSLQKSEKFKENAVKCLNGEYEIQLFVDDVFNENQNKLKKYDQAISTHKKNRYNSWNHERVYKKLHNKLIKEYAIKDIGSYIFSISLKK